MFRNKFLSLLLIIALLLSTGITALGQPSDISAHWAKKQIIHMVEKDVLQGYPDGSFKPDNPMSKVEFYRVINQLFEFNSKAEINFKDVQNSKDWYYAEIQRAVKKGYIKESEYLKPNEPITREEVARIIGVISQLAEAPEKADVFIDKFEISNEIKGYIGALEEMNLIAGYPDGSFRPKDTITRAEVITILYNLLVDEDSQIDKIPDITITKYLNETYDLPKEIKVAGKDGITKDYKVIWDENKVDTDKLGTFTFIGTVRGYEGKVKLIVTVSSYDSRSNSSKGPNGPVIPVDPPKDFAGGIGTELDPYLVSNADQLDNVRKHRDKFFKQIADIVWPDGRPFEPIGGSAVDEEFTGSYDGNSLTISDIEINQPDEWYISVFGRVREATLKNIKLADIQIIGGSFAGGLAGDIYGSTVDGCHIMGDTTVTSTANRVGGLIGIADYTTITNSSSNATVINNGTGSTEAGGLIGAAEWCTIHACTATGDVEGRMRVGGLIGFLNRSSVDNCHVEERPSISALYQNLGGLVGYVQKGNIENSSSDATVATTDSSSNVGGLVGGADTCTINKCFASGTVEGKSYVGGLVGRIELLAGAEGEKSEISNSCATGAVTGIDSVGGLVGYRDKTAITNVYAIGRVIGSEKTGGLAGTLGAGIFTSCYYNSEASGQSDDTGRGTPKTTAEMKIQGTYVDWDFTDTWGINETKNGGYPFLK